MGVWNAWRHRKVGGFISDAMFRHDLSVEVGEIVSRDGFVFADLSLRPDA